MLIFYMSFLHIKFLHIYPFLLNLFENNIITVNKIFERDQ
jgi:hypothetical protein